MDKKLRIALILSWLIAVFYLFPAPLLSIILNAISYLTKPGFRAGNPLVSLKPFLTLIVGLLFAACLIYLKRGSSRARLAWLGFLTYFIYSCTPSLPTLNPQGIAVFLLSFYCLIIGLHSIITEKTYWTEIGRGLRGITEGFLWLSALSICVGWSLVIAQVFVVMHYKSSTIINGIVNLALVVPLLIYTAVSLYKKRETAPAVATVVLLAAGLAGLVTYLYLPVFYYLRYPYDGPVMDINRYVPVCYNIAILITYNIYHVLCLVLAGFFLFRFKKKGREEVTH